MIGKREQMSAQLGKGDVLLNRDTIVHHVKIRFSEIDHTFALQVFDVGIGDVPLRWHSPIKNLRTRPNFVCFHWDVISENPQCVSNTIASNAPTDGIKLSNKAMHVIANIVLIRKQL
jgi:hypothetical protein